MGHILNRILNEIDFRHSFFHSLLVRRLPMRWAVSSCWLSTDRIVPQGPKVPFGDVDLAATTASMEEELALLRAKNECLQALNSAGVKGTDYGGA